MARRKIDQWGITYVVPIWRAGYEWRASSNGAEPVLAPKGSGFTYSEKPAKKDLEELRNPIVTQTGVAFSRRAFNAFRRLSEKLTSPIGMDDARDLVIEFANTYGPLREHFQPETLRDWQHEANTFLDMLEISRAIRRLQFTDFRRGVEIKEHLGFPYGRTLVYRGSRPASQEFTIAHEADVTPLLTAPNMLARTLNDFDEAMSGGPSVQAKMLLSKITNQYLIGGMSFKPSWVDTSQFFFTPVSLLPMIYMKLWIDTVKEEDIDRVMTCLTCDKPLVGRRSKKFCDDACRNAFHNRRRPVKETSPR